MARHVVKREGGMVPNGVDTRITAEDGTPLDKAPIPGGASGQPDTSDPNPASTMIHGLQDIAPAPERATIIAARPPRRFQVVGGPDRVMYQGAVTRVVHGKIYVETAVDLDLLRAQGVVFQELDLPPSKVETLSPPAQENASA